MALWPDSIVMDGAAIALADVIADVTIHHGRKEITDAPAATTCQFTIQDVDPALAKGFRVGAPLAVTVTDGTTSTPRFTGTVTDASLDVGELTVIAVGRIATLRRYKVGTVAWPVEPWSARITRLFAEAGMAAALELHADPLFDPPLAARDPATAGATTLGDYLGFLAPMVGAAVTDRPDGRILVQAIGARTLDGAVALDPALVAYAPVWVQVLPAGNIVTVRYTGDQSQSVTVRDDSSVARFGERPRTIDTTFTSVGDATARANEALGRGANPRWNILEAPVLAGMPLAIGQPVKLSGMPPTAPYDPWTPIVEGWQDSIVGDDWTMALALSDPLESGLLVAWNTVPPGETWNTIDPVIAWNEVNSLDDLIGA